MERESFIFYRSFYEAIKCLPAEVQVEIYPAICEYALFGRLPRNLSKVTKAVFALIKPNIDVNTARFENGKKGAMYGKRGGRPKKQVTATAQAYSLTYDQEIEQMRSNEDWKTTICNDFSITADEYDSRLLRFLDHCNDEKKRKGRDRHDSIDDAQSHFRYWMTKAYPNTSRTCSKKTKASRASKTSSEDKRLQREALYNRDDALKGEALARKLAKYSLDGPAGVDPEQQAIADACAL